MSEQLGITVKKDEDIAEWYQQLILKGGFADYSPVKGCIVIKPWGYAIWENMQKIFDSWLKEHGVENAYFPLFIPERLLKKEAEHFEGFVPEVAWVTKGGEKELEEPLAVRPTSETIMYSIISNWISSYRDLPLRINQWVNVVRWETKMTKPFIRGREFLWHETHTLHATKEEAEKEVFWAIKAYEKFAKEVLAIPSIAGYKTEGEKFAGAEFTTTIEGIMPDGKAIQLGTAHMLGQHFSKAYGIEFLDKDEKKKFVWQTSYGISTRLLGAMLLLHGDDKGAILPPKVAPLQVVIVPIYKKGNEKILDEFAKDLEKRLKEAGIRVKADLRKEYTPGWKFNDWELKGVPLRIDIGPREIESKKLTIKYRTGERKTIELNNLINEIKNSLEEIQKIIYNRALDLLNDKTKYVKSLEEAKEEIGKGNWVKAHFCLSKECEEKVKEQGFEPRVIPFEQKDNEGKCIICGKKTNKIVYFGRAY